MNKLKILELDFETSPALGYFFGGIWETNIIEIVEFEHILCVGYKWFGENKVSIKGLHDFPLYKKDKHSDKDLVMFFADLMKEADIVIGHNADRFDLTVFNTRLLAHGLDPVPPRKSIDTKKIAKNIFHFPSNKLDNIATFLGIGNKLPTNKQLWFDYMKGDKKAIRQMESYCKQDVALLDKVLIKLSPFMKQINDFSKMDDRPNCVNPLCLSHNLIKVKTRLTAAGRKQQYQCMDCGSYRTDNKIIK